MIGRLTGETYEVNAQTLFIVRAAGGITAGDGRVLIGTAPACGGGCGETDGACAYTDVPCAICDNGEGCPLDNPNCPTCDICDAEGCAICNVEGCRAEGHVCPQDMTCGEADSGPCGTGDGSCETDDTVEPCTHLDAPPCAFDAGCAASQGSTPPCAGEGSTPPPPACGSSDSTGSTSATHLCCRDDPSGPVCGPAGSSYSRACGDGYLPSCVTLAGYCHYVRQPGQDDLCNPPELVAYAQSWNNCRSS